MSRAVFLLLLASCVTMGPALRCYECISEDALPASITSNVNISLAVSEGCSPDTFDNSSINTVAISASDVVTGTSVLESAYCLMLVAHFEDQKEVTVRGPLLRSDVMALTGGAYSSGSDPSTIPPIMALVLMTTQSSVTRTDVSLCSSDLCNSGPCVAGSVAVVAAAALLAIMANGAANIY